MRRIAAGILLVLLVVVPFFDWRLGSVMWMSAWLVFILQKLFSRKEWRYGDKDEFDEPEDRKENDS